MHFIKVFIFKGTYYNTSITLIGQKTINISHVYFIPNKFKKVKYTQKLDMDLHIFNE